MWLSTDIARYNEQVRVASIVSCTASLAIVRRSHSCSASKHEIKSCFTRTALVRRWPILAIVWAIQLGARTDVDIRGCFGASLTDSIVCTKLGIDGLASPSPEQ